MEFFQWIADHWFALLQSSGIVGGLIYTAASFQLDANARRVGNLLLLTESHRDLWTQLYRRPELSRVLKRKVDLKRKPITEDEEVFVTILVHHLHAAFRSIKAGMYLPSTHGIEQDIREVFSLPLPRLMWERLRPLQDKEFAAYVDDALDIL